MALRLYFAEGNAHFAISLQNEEFAIPVFCWQD